MSKQASPAKRVGDNGFYYFTYDCGAEYEVKTSVGVAIYEILACIYRDGVESYAVRVTSGGVAKERELTLQRLSYVFDTAQSKELFKPHNKELSMPEYLRERYDKNNRKNDQNGK